jgi:hypothetical protein
MSFLRRLFCPHLRWVEVYSPTTPYPAWWEQAWACERCGKRIVRAKWDEPIQFVSEEAKREAHDGRA